MCEQIAGNSTIVTVRYFLAVFAYMYKYMGQCLYTILIDAYQKNLTIRKSYDILGDAKSNLCVSFIFSAVLILSALQSDLRKNEEWIETNLAENPLI